MISLSLYRIILLKILYFVHYEVVSFLSGFGIHSIPLWVHDWDFLWCKQLRDCLELSLLRIQLVWFWWTDQLKVPNLHHAVLPKCCRICCVSCLDYLFLLVHVLWVVLTYLGVVASQNWNKHFVTNDAYNETSLHCGIDAVIYLEYHVKMGTFF